MAISTVLKFLGLIACGLLAGSFLYGILNLVPTFYEVPMDVHLKFRTQLMNHNSATMQLLMFIAIVMPLWYGLLHRKQRAVFLVSVLAALLTLTSLLVTRFGNVPINIMMRTWDFQALPANWKSLLEEWDRYNLIRCLTGIGSFVAFIFASHFTNALNRN